MYFVNIRIQSEYRKIQFRNNSVFGHFLRDADTRKFVTFLLLDLGQNVMNNNGLSIHIESGNIFYQIFNTRENFYNFLIAQQNEETANIPKKMSGHNNFVRYIDSFLPSFFIDYVEKFDLYSNKNAKYLFYRFNDYIRAYGNKRKKIKHTQKIKNSVGMQKIEERNKQFW